MNLNTTYLNIPLRSPLVVSASPLSESIDNIKRMEDSGAAAIVLYSLFEEQVRTEQQIRKYLEGHPRATPSDVVSLFPSQERFPALLEEYLIHILKAQESVEIPIIASLNCTSLGSWTDFAAKIEEAGADALELNIYFIPTDMDMKAEQVEDMYIRILKVVKGAVKIPVAVKLSPFITNMANMARRLDDTGADALVLFNRFYQPDFDPKTLKIQSNVLLSTPQDMRLPLHWIAILYKYLHADLAATGGIHTAEDVVKMLMVGAKVTMITSALLQEGIEYLRVLENNLIDWLDQNDHSSVAALQGIVSQFHSKDVSAFERTEYVQAITSYKSIV